MANKNLFNSNVSLHASVPVADAVNLAGGKAYKLTAKQAIAQYAVTGTFNGTYYADADKHLKSIQALLKDSSVDADFIAKLAVYSRESAYMKDMPAFLLAVLSTKDVNLFKKTFPKVIDNSKMLRNFVQIVRSGVLGRKSLGSAPKKAIKFWFDSRTDEQLFADSVGNDPSLVDVIRLAHVKPNSNVREALFKYFMGSEVADKSALPQVVREFEDFKVNHASKAEAPKVPFQMLTSLPLSEKHWKKIAKDAKWQMTRMNLNTFARHGVFNSSELVDLVAERLRDPKNVAFAKAFPYQLFAAYKSADEKVPNKVRNALQDAMEHAVKNVPNFGGKKIFVGVDVSGSMQSPITGDRMGVKTSAINCNEVAALIAAAMVKANDNTEVYQFDTACKLMKALNARDSVMTNIQKIAFSGGGTDCSCVLRELNKNNSKGDFVVIVSDNMSWLDWNNTYRSHQGTGMQHEWAVFKKRNPNAKLINIDLQPNLTAQVTPSKDVLCVGGFSDNVFSIINAFVENEKNEPDFWVSTIEKVSLSSD